MACHTGITDDTLYARVNDDRYFCPSDFYKVPSGGTAVAFAENVCNQAVHANPNFSCVGCRPTNISVGDRYPYSYGVANYLAWHG